MVAERQGLSALCGFLTSDAGQKTNLPADVIPVRQRTCAIILHGLYSFLLFFRLNFLFTPVFGGDHESSRVCVGGSGRPVDVCSVSCDPDRVGGVAGCRRGRGPAPGRPLRRLSLGGRQAAGCHLDVLVVAQTRAGGGEVCVFPG